MASLWVVVLIVVAYLVAVSAVSLIARKSGRTSEGFVRGGRTFPAVVIGLFLASEVIGTSSSVGTAQGAFKHGISAAWNLVALGIGFIAFAVLLASKFKRLDQVTISGALDQAYGPGVRRAASITMIVALQTAAIATYTSGGAVISSLLGINSDWAVLIVGVLSSVYVAVGGMRSVVYTNLINIAAKVLGIVIVAMASYMAAGGYHGIQMALPPKMLSWDGVGWDQIGAWLIAGGGAMFSTQYVVQSMITVGTAKKARAAGVYTSLILIPYGILAALIGVCALVVHPKIPSLQALPSMVLDLNPVLAGIAVTGLLASVFGVISALTIGSATLLLKDFYQPYFNKEGYETKSVRFVRLASIACGLIPVVLAVFATDVLSVTFLGKALRSLLAVFVVLMFYRPSFGSRQGAMAAIWISTAATIGWYIAGDPLGVDNAYVAILVPIVVMGIAHLTGRGDKPSTPIQDAVNTASVSPASATE